MDPPEDTRSGAHEEGGEVVLARLSMRFMGDIHIPAWKSPDMYDMKR
jgi:hypothetical protein